MAQEPRTVQPVEFFEPGRQPAFGKDFTVYRTPADVPQEVKPEVEEDPKGSSATESVPYSDLIPSGTEVGLADAEKDLSQGTTDPSTQTSSTALVSETGSETPPAPSPAPIQTSGSQDSERLPEETKPSSSASDAQSVPSVTTTVPAPTPTKASGQASSTTNRRKAT